MPSPTIEPFSRSSNFYILPDSPKHIAKLPRRIQCAQGVDRHKMETAMMQLVDEVNQHSHPHLWSNLSIVYVDQNLMAIKMPFYEDGPVLSYLHKNSSVSRKVEICLEVASAVAYLHRHNKVHGEICSRNVLVSDGQAKLINGCSPLELSLDRSNPSLDIPYVDPALLTGSMSAPTKETDVFALGRLIYDIISGSPPVSPRRAATLAVAVRDGWHPDQSKVSEEIWNLCETCWSTNPHDRVSAAMLESWLQLVTYGSLST